MYQLIKNVSQKEYKENQPLIMPKVSQVTQQTQKLKRRYRRTKFLQNQYHPK